MIDLNHYKKEDGRIDWTAYDQAQVASGEKCSKCMKYIIRWSSTLPGPRMCVSCRGLYESDDKCDHSDRIRCPACGNIARVSDLEYYEIYTEGEHDVTCCECEHEFSIDTMIEYNFTSPEKIKK